MNGGDWDELAAQVEDHGADKVVFIMQSDDGEGIVMVTDVKFQDNRIEVRLA